MDQHTLDIRCGGGAGVKRGIVPVTKLGPAIGVVQVDHDVGRIEQHDQVLREVGDRVGMEVGLAQEDRAGLGNGKGRADDGEVDIRRSCGAPIPAMSRFPAISGTTEHTILAPAIFSRTGARTSPESGGSRNMPPIWCRLVLNASSSTGGSLSNSGTSGSGRSTGGRFARIEARMSSRLLIAFLRDWPDTSCERSVWADGAPRGACPKH